MGFGVRESGEDACWGTDGESFFHRAYEAPPEICERNWFEGTPGSLGRKGHMPTDNESTWHFQTGVPALPLLGFDKNKDQYCASKIGHHGENTPGGMHANWCVMANANIMGLGLGGRDAMIPMINGHKHIQDPFEYNMCRHFEWLMCAARGRLPGQEGATGLRLVTMPHVPTFVEGGSIPLGSCHESWCPRGSGRKGHSTSDVFYLESCILGTICRNYWRLFTPGVLKPGDDFHCDLSDKLRYDELKQIILDTEPNEKLAFIDTSPCKVGTPGC